MNILAKSPFNYMGNKYKQLDQLFQIFPDNINTFMDLFTGGGDVAANVIANKVKANDINNLVIGILQSFQNNSIEDILTYMDKRIQEFNLSKVNEDGYFAYRELYNTNPEYNTPLDLFTLTRYSFNNTIRFSKKMEFNSAFGRNRSSFNFDMRNNTIAFQAKLQNIEFMSMDFRNIDLNQFNENDFLYADPPYLITKADYNIGRTAKITWKEEDEYALYKYLDEATSKNIKWAVSNFFKYKGQENTIIQEWALKNNYIIHPINSDYTKLTRVMGRQLKENEPTIEVVITNYKKE